MDVKCPICGKDMVSGFLGSESFFGGVKWYSEKTALALHGEKIKDPEFSGMVYIDSLRCTECKLIMARY